MEIKIPKFERKEIEIKETYVDSDGHLKERIKKVSFPTGNCLNDEENDKKKD